MTGLDKRLSQGIYPECLGHSVVFATSGPLHCVTSDSAVIFDAVEQQRSLSTRFEEAFAWLLGIVSMAFNEEGGVAGFRYSLAKLAYTDSSAVPRAFFITAFILASLLAAA